jgi:hypothetical protein
VLLRFPVIACGLLLVIPSGPAEAQDSLSLPAPILTVFRQAYPHARILNASRERRDGKVVYEIESLDGSLRRDLLYDLEGHAIEIEEILPADSLPEAVRAAVARDMPKADVVGAERVIRGVVILYEVQVRHAGRTEFLTYDPTGQRHE